MAITLKKDICTRCGKNSQLLLSNNPLVPSYCEDCLNELVDYKNMRQVAFFCRTYNIPLIAERWITIAEKAKHTVFRHYINVIADEFPDTQYNNPLKLKDYWDDVDKAWKEIRTHKEAIKELSPIKDEFMVQMQIKWGNRFTFEQYLQLENLYTNTLRATGITDPLKKDMIKKIAIISVDMEQALASGNIKDAKEYSSMHKTYAASVGLDDLVELTDGEVLSTLADVAEYLEDNGFQFKYYDNVTRDIVDITIRDQKEWYQNFFSDATGIQQTYERIEAAYKNKLELEQTDAATAELSLDDLIEQNRDGVNLELDTELAAAVIDDGFLDEEEV